MTRPSKQPKSAHAQAGPHRLRLLPLVASLLLQSCGGIKYPVTIGPATMDNTGEAAVGMKWPWKRQLGQLNFLDDVQAVR